MYKIVSQETGQAISGLMIRSGIGMVGRMIGDVTPSYDLTYDDFFPLLFPNIELCYSFITFLSLVGFEALMFDIVFTDDY